MLPPRLAPSTTWADKEIARLSDLLVVASHRHAELVVEVVQLRRELFAERSCNDVVRGLTEALADAAAAVVG